MCIYYANKGMKMMKKKKTNKAKPFMKSEWFSISWDGFGKNHQNNS